MSLISLFVFEFIISNNSIQYLFSVMVLASFFFLLFFFDFFRVSADNEICVKREPCLFEVYMVVYHSILHVFLQILNVIQFSVLVTSVDLKQAQAVHVVPAINTFGKLIGIEHEILNLIFTYHYLELFLKYKLVFFIILFVDFHFYLFCAISLIILC